MAALAIACGSSDGDNGDPPPEDLSAQEVLEQAAEAIQDVTSFRFELTHQNGSTPLPLGLELVAANGEMSLPAALRADIEARAVGINVNVEVISVDSETWVTNPFTRRWESLGNADIRDFADPHAIVQQVLPLLDDAEVQGTASVGGVNTYALRGSIDSGALQSALGLAESGRIVQVEAWIGVEDSLPRRIRLNGPLSNDDASNVVRQVDISQFNQPVTIEPPE